MNKKFRLSVFGKTGCDKCKVLKERLSSLLAKDEYSEFSLEYFDISTEDGLLDFVKRESLNPQRIPSFVVERFDNEHQRYVALENSESRDLRLRVRPWRYLGLETDYSEKGKGIIRPQALHETLQRALSL